MDPFDDDAMALTTPLTDFDLKLDTVGGVQNRKSFSAGVCLPFATPFVRILATKGFLSASASSTLLGKNAFAQDGFPRCPESEPSFYYGNKFSSTAETADIAAVPN